MLINNNIAKCLNNNKLLRFYCKNTKSKNYKDTVLLPKTKFPQRLTKNLIEQNKNVYEKGGFKDLYSWQKADIQKPEFVLHDGPPYANGMPHMGHMINKILKDIINRYQIIKGKRVHYIPGWDCHGLPIELKALNKVKKDNITPLHIRSTAHKFATKTIEEQSKIFQSWGVIGDWNNSYHTYNVSYIKNQLKQFYKLYEKKLVYRDFKPVYWSPSSRTALAEAELQYNENHSSTSIILRLKLSKIPEIIKFYNNEIYALIWTTTPWTLPSNQAVCFNPDLSYSLIQNKDKSEMYIVATELIEQICKTLNASFDTISSFSGKALSDTKYIHPFHKSEEYPFLPGDHATASKGTGLVHTAPAHGPEDFLLALNHRIPVKCMVDEYGRYTDEADTLKGLEVLTDGNEAVLKMLQSDILSTENYIHSYPYDWRTNKPVILRASQQWFIDTNALKERAVELLNNVKIVPERNNEIYKQNLINQVTKRPYWCISRQRVWGVPIPVFYNQSKPIITQSLDGVIIEELDCSKLTGKTPYNEEALKEMKRMRRLRPPNRDSILNLCNLLEKHGPDFWWSLPTSQLIPSDILKEHNISSNDVEKGQDIFDIWFDSGVSWSYALENNQVADMYLEGVDQFNGWFQSSLLLSVALRDKAPYKTIFVHGFAVDQNGLKMSKSLGNVVDPQELIGGGKKQQPLGIDPLRWWVACHASTGSTAFVSPNVLQASQDEVQKIRNTLRFAIGALGDYKHNKNYINNLQAIDKYLLHLNYEFDKQVTTMFEDYQFNKMCITVINFITNPVSALYYSVIKDRLYCNSIDDPDRRSAQYVLSILLETICKAISPIVPHLVEEVYMYRTDKEYETFFKGKKININEDWNQPDIAKSVELALNIKKYINKQFSNTLELKLELIASSDVIKNLQIFQKQDDSELLEIFQIAEISLKENPDMNLGSYNLNLTKSVNVLCGRCRKYTSKIEGCLCNRCLNVVDSLIKIKTVN